MGRGRADILLVPASEWETIKHLHQEQAAFRAVESGVSLVRPARWGISSVVDPLGRVLAVSDHFTTMDRSVVGYVPISGTRTLYASVGDAFGWLSVLCLATLASWSLIA